MKSYYDLIKTSIIDFDKLVIEKYHLMGIDEVDAIILIKLNTLLKRGESSLSLNKIAPTMSLSIEDLSKRVMTLVSNGFIRLSLGSDKKETFSLDETFKRLSIVISDEDTIKEVATRNNDVKYVVTILERELKKILSSIEREMVNKWIYEYKYSLEEITDALNDALRYKNRGINYIDKVLYRKNHKEEEPQATSSEIQDLFKKVVYDKKKWVYI